MLGGRFGCNSSGAGLIIYYLVKMIVAKKVKFMVLNKIRILAL